MITSTNKILITGCGGMLGDAVYHTFKDRADVRATDIDLNEPWLSHLDIRDAVEVKTLISEYKPDYVFHLAAHTDMEFCEKNVEEAYRTNAIGTENVMRECQARSVPMVYIGTAGVFDGAQALYNDYDAPHPLSIYAKSKFGGEMAVRHHLLSYYIFRAGWMMGGGPKKDKKFVGKIIRQILAGKKELFVVDDKIGSPTFTYDFAASLLGVVESGNIGLYHMAGHGDCSRYDVAAEMLKLLGLEKKITLHKVDSNHFAKEYFAPRPDSEKLDNMRLRLQGLDRMRDWRESLADYLQRYDWGIH